MTEWKYGDAWERFPIDIGTVWRHKESGSAVTVHDIRDPLPGFMNSAEMVYCDPPWTQGNVNSFVTKAGSNRYVSNFKEFLASLMQALRFIGANRVYLEAGEKHAADLADMLRVDYPHIQMWRITYYRSKPCWLVRGGVKPIAADFSGLDDEHTPLAALQAERPESVADPCTGRGLTMVSAHRQGIRFCGTELARRRLAVAIDKCARMGVRYEPDPPDVSP